VTSGVNKIMSLDNKMKKIDNLVVQLEEEVGKICTDTSCKMIPEEPAPKKSENTDSNTNTRS
jgi:hypothetical protein